MKNSAKIAGVICILIGMILLAGCVSDTTNLSSDNKTSPVSPEPTTRPQEIPAVIDTKESGTMGSEGQGSAEYLTDYNNGIDLIQKGLYDEAIDAFSESIKANSSFTPAYYQRGLANYELGRKFIYEGKELRYFEKAVEDFSTVLQSDPSDTESLTMRGWSNFWIGLYYFERVYEKNSTISSYFERGIDDCDRALKIDPRNIDALNGRGMNSLWRVRGNYLGVADTTYLDKGKADAEASLKINSTNPWAHFILGMYYIGEQGYTLADESYSKAIRLDPDEAYFYYWASRAKFGIDKQKGIDDLSKAIELQPRYALAHNAEAAFRSYLGTDYESSLSGYEEAIEIDPTVAVYYTNYAKSLWNLKYWDKNAQEQVLNLDDRALEIDPTDYRIHGDKALILMYLDRGHESTNEILEFKKHARTTEDFKYADAILAYNGAQPWYFNL